MAQLLSLPPPSMQPLTRQESRRSVFSWWSDSNPGLLGATINLHAAAKPLLKLMYHRQALGIMKKTRGDPLSTETMEIYSSYLPWDYVSSATKVKILWELRDRAATCEADAHLIVHHPVPEFLTGMLDSPDPDVRNCSCRLVGALASRECIAPAIMDLKPCARLLSLLLDNNIQVIFGASHALSQIARWPDGAQAIVNAKRLKHVSDLFHSPSRRVRRRTCELVIERWWWCEDSSGLEMG
ncbi:hypothetical protein DFH06DRAFT_660448 [Mycena polygramma]|nr:hypothetical protein DFH06DRAFT_660448 [Mycena polygramma]